MKKTFAGLLAGAAVLAAMPASAGTFMVDIGSAVGSPGGGGNTQNPKIRVVNTSGDAANPATLTPYLLTLTLTLDGSTPYSLTGFSSFGGGNFYGTGTDASPTVQATGDVVLTPPKSGTITYPAQSGNQRFDPGAYSSFQANISGYTAGQDFTNAFFTGTNKLVATFSDGTSAEVVFSGNPTSNGTSFNFLSTPVGGAVPEPATWALMILGFGMVGGAMRSTRRQARIRFA